ncbi:MAG TPA: hypothetical protein PK745_15320 [bacterium]|nr:hypothetical protein [bacterium]
MENNLIVQLGSVLLTLVVSLFGIFRGLVPKVMESFEKRLADKDTVLAHQNQALDEVCKERKDLTENFLRSLQEIVVQNATSMSALTTNLTEFRKQVHDEHEEQHLNHRDILSLLQEKKPAGRRSANKAAVK